MKALQQKSTPAAGKSGTKKGTRANGSDFSSARGSEERHVSTATQSGRGPRRNRDYDLENVSVGFLVCFAECQPFMLSILMKVAPDELEY
jgi:hypothetical protein